MIDLEGKVALITGGGQGLGEAIVSSLAQHNAIVIPVDIQEEKVEKIAEEITKNGGKAKSYALDVTNETNVLEVIDRTISEFGTIDIIINNAGIDVTKSVEEITVQEWEKVIRVNLIGPFLLSKAVLRYFYKQQKGHIINIASTAALRAWPNASAYHASKWGLLGFTYSLYTEARQHNVKVTAVIAGGMRTPFILERFPGTPVTNLQDPKNVAETIAYILSQPEETIIPEVMVIPMQETSWP